MRELHDEEVEKKKTEIRKSLNLPKEDKDRRSAEPKDKYARGGRGSRGRSKSLDSLSDSLDDVSGSMHTRRDKFNRPERDRRDRERSPDKNRRLEKPYYPERDRERPRERYPDRDRERDQNKDQNRDRERDQDRDRERERERDRDRERERDRDRGHDRHDIELREKPYRKPTSREEFHDGSRSPLRYEERNEYGARGPNPYKWSAGQPKAPYPYSSRYYGREMSPSKIPKYDDKVDEEPEDDGPITVVTVLRLLSALEELLGPSLGPKIVELLAKALALEKVKPNAADELLLNDENCVLFETIKEKLKGLLISDMVERQRIKGVKKAIKNIAGLLHIASNSEKEKQVLESKKDVTALATDKTSTKIIAPSSSTSVASTSAPSATTVTTTATAEEEKVAIAKKIASALVAQGKANISKEELESLVNYYYEKQRKAREESEKQKEPDANNDAESTSSRQSSIVKQESIDLTEEDNLDNTQNDDEGDSQDFGLPQDASNALESLTDSDLQTLLQNFEDLSAEEQTHLHTYMKTLEASDPARVEKLRKYVRTPTETQTAPSLQSVQPQHNDQPSVNRQGNRSVDSNRSDPKNRSKTNADPFDDMFYDDSTTKKNDNKIERIIDSDDDDDYSYDDVCKAASKNVQEKKVDASNWVRFYIFPFV